MRRHARASTAGSTERKPSDLGGSSPARGRLAAVLAFAAALAVLAFSAASASATPPELSSLETFGSSAQPTFTRAEGMAVDQSTGDLLVIDQEAGNVSRYHADGTPANFSALGTNKIEGLAFGEPGEVQIAVDNSGGPTDGDIYVPQVGAKAVDVFASSGELIGQLTESTQGELGEPCGVAVDPAGNVYVGDFSGFIHKYEPAANPPVNADSSANFGFEGNCTLAAGAGATNGYIFAAHYYGSLAKLNSTTGAVQYEVTPETTATVSVDPASGRVYTASAVRVLGFNASSPSSATEVSRTVIEGEFGNGPQGVAINGSTHNVYVDTGHGSPNVEVFAQPTGPTNRRTLTVTKSANGPGGTGTVSSKPKGIKCGATCSSAVGSFYENSPVVLTVKPSLTSTFTEWEGGDCEGITATTCTVTMDQAEEVTAVFGGTAKTITPTEALAVSKGESSGFGTVKASGLACEAECTQTVVLYQGPIVEKSKPGKTVVLTEVAAPGSAFVEWGGACSGTGACEVEMSEAKEVTAEFEALPAETLTVAKSANGPGGTGTVSSKPKGIKCGATCSSASATFWEGAAVVLTVKPSLTSTFTEWEGGDCEGITATTCTVTLNTSEEVTAVFGGTAKTITPTEALTLTKAGSGLGTVKASGLACEVLCSSTTVLYQGPIVEKSKPGKLVVLTEIAAPGSEFVEWTGACTGTGACEVEMSEAKSVGAVFDELP